MIFAIFTNLTKKLLICRNLKSTIMTNILITGGTGLIGSELCKLLIKKSYNVAVLSRSKDVEGVKSFYWDYTKGILDEEAIEFADIIVHLAGENISNKRWNNSQKQKIFDSRIKTTDLLFAKTDKAKKKPHSIISTSAIAYYGTETTDKIFKENDEPGKGFLPETVVNWEKSVDKFSKLGIRTLKLRTGVVLSNEGGALKKMSAPVKFGLGAALGNGKQYIPWIEISDLAEMFLFAIENKNLKGAFNAVAPDYINNFEFMKTLASSLNKAFFMPNIPAFIIKLLYGEMSVILLEGSRISSEKIQSAGFDFKFKNVENVLNKFYKSI